MKGKNIKRIRSGYECEGERKKINSENKKYYLYHGLWLFTLGYISWIGLSGFQKSQLVFDLWYPFIRFFNPLSSIISKLSNFNELC